MRITGALQTQITKLKKKSAMLIIPPTPHDVFRISAAQQEQNNWYPSCEGYDHPQHYHAQITCACEGLEEGDDERRIQHQHDIPLLQQSFSDLFWH